jgi:predicted RNA-binding Zn ribbon-like protein
MMGGDWRDGFPFLGNHLALDFLNTRPVMGGQAVEMLPDCSALARWLAAANLTTESRAARLKRSWSDAAIEMFWRLRENLRKVVFRIEAGESIRSDFIKELNWMLRQYPYTDQVVPGKSGLEREKCFAPETPQDALAPLADAIADLLTNTDWGRIRKCRGCVVHFYDTSKKGTRIWCSMDLCGNRSKVAAYAERKRTESRGI